MTRPPLLARIVLDILLVIFGGIVLQAPISVGFGVIFPHEALLIKGWAEVLIALAGLLLLGILVQQKNVAQLKDPLVYLGGTYILIHLLLVPFRFHGVQQVVAGLLIDVRFVAFFVIMYIFLRLYPRYARLFLYVFMGASVVVVGFALLQVFVLPPDVLHLIGYSKATIAPYLTVDQNHHFIRINSTLRGPNPVGAYALIVLSVVLGYLLKKHLPSKWLPRLTLLVLLVGGVVALYASYSRSAVLGLLVAVGVIVASMYRGRMSRRVWLIGAGGLIIMGGLIAVASHAPGVSQVVLHEDPSRASLVNSNDGHAASLLAGLRDAATEPLGGGIGSTGSASLLGTQPFIVEDQYLFEAHETGWVGLIIFLLLSGVVLWKLWALRRDWIPTAVAASGIGLLVVGVLLPVWVDDTISLIWWGLAAVALAPTQHERYTKK